MTNGSIVPGNEIDGFHDRPQESWEICIERSKKVYANKHRISFGHRVKDFVTFCYKK
jgi:hypothetical protein